MDSTTVSREHATATTGPIEVGALHPKYAAQSSYAVDRRLALKLIVACAATIGFTVLGLFRSVRRASAYTEHLVSSNGQLSKCGSFDPDTWYGGSTQNGYHDPFGCENGACVGAAQNEMGRYLCVKCNEISGSNPFQWHYVGTRPGGYSYGDHTNVCTVDGDARDAWRWQQSTCGSCTPATWRCHDGWKIDNGTFHSLTICQGLVYCNGFAYALYACN